MRVATKCSVCFVGKLLVYSVARFGGYLVRYKRCSECGRTSKSIVLLTSKRELDPVLSPATIHVVGADYQDSKILKKERETK